MTSFVKKIVVFLLGLLLIFGVLSYLYSFRVGSRDNFYALVDRFDDPSIQPKVLVLGDSRPTFGIRQEFLPSDIYNFSFPSETYREMFLKVEYALQKKPSIKYIAIPIDYHMLSAFYARDKDAGHMYRIASLQNIRAVYGFSWVEFCKSFFHAYVPLTDSENRFFFITVIKKDLRALFTRQQNPRSISVTPYGDLAPLEHKRWGDFSDEAKYALTSRRIEDHLLSGSLVEREMVDALDKLLYLAQARGVQVIAVRYPLTTAYENRARKLALAEVEHAFDEHAHRFLLVLNYVVSFESHEDDLFQDADHLNTTGAEVFTNMFVRDLHTMLK